MSFKSSQVLWLVGAAVTAAFAIAVAIIALGGEATASRADYQASVSNARDRVDFALVRITKSESTEELIERIDEASALVDDTASDLDDAGVAEGFDEENDRLVDTLQRFADELAGTAAQFQDPTFAGTLGSITSLGFKEWENVNKILGEMRERGLDVELLERH